MLLALVALALATPAASAAPAPDGTPLCPEAVHDRYSVTVNGRTWPTWHPPRDPVHGCAFGHEHGSNPRAFRFFRRTGMPAFGRTTAHAGTEEPHAGFKVFVANSDRKGLAWMVVLHQGSGSPRRSSVRFHSLETWLFRLRDGRRVARTRHMADFGAAIPNCRDAGLAPSMRLLPMPGCESAYEEWDTELDVGGVFRGRPGFGIENPITQFDPAAPERVLANKDCGPGGWDSRCKGDRRVVFHPQWRVRNRGPARFRTDVHGRRAARGIPQFVSSRVRVDQRDECCGVENAFVMERPSDGGIYRAGRGLHSRGFEFPGYCVLAPN